MQCQICTVVFSPVLWEHQANEQLEEEWFGEGYQEGRSFWVTMFEAWNNRRTLRRLIQAKPQGNRLLEIGVGSGSFLNIARERGYQVMGCDLSGSICECVRRTYKIEMHQKPLSTLVGENRFDVIVMNHVLEHVQQPREFLKDVHRLLASRGILYIAVPNLGCWEAQLSGWTSFEPYHLIYFDRQTLELAVLSSGLLIDYTTTHDSFSGWFLALLRTVLGVNRNNGAIARHAASKVGFAEGPRSRIVEHIYRITMVFVGVIGWPLRWFQAKLGCGDEAICIARKPHADEVE